MTMMLTKLTTYWTPAQACEMLMLLDELRDQLWETHGDRIIEYRLNECSNVMPDGKQQPLDLEDEPF
jgi:hypothetical protein